MNDRPGWRHESIWRAWLRRSFTIPVYLTITGLLVLLSPVLLLAAVMIDILRRRRFAITRCLALSLVFFAAEFVGMLASLVIWLRYRGWRSTPSEAYLAANFTLQRKWASAIFAGARWTFRLRVRIDGDEALGPGPVIILGRHASPLDNLMPAVVASGRHRLRLRWVINRWLLRDPCLDIVGNRLPNAFVATTSQEPRGQSGRVGALAQGLGADEGVLIFPEGALFNPRRLQRAIARLTEAGADEAEQAADLRSVLPPRSGAFLSALATAPDADVVFCEHRGLDIARGYRALASGELVGSAVAIRIRRIPRSQIPTDPGGQTAWLWSQWIAVDRWVRNDEVELPEAGWVR